MRTEHTFNNPFTWLAAIYLVVILGVLGCATKPVGTTQTIYAAGWTIVGATNSVADLHDSGQLKGADYEKAKEILAQATAAYKNAESLAIAGKVSDAESAIRLAQSTLNQLAIYLTAKGVK
jgi:hypothetical protein